MTQQHSTQPHQDARLPDRKLHVAIKVRAGDDHLITKHDTGNATAGGRHLKLIDESKVFEQQMLVALTLF